MGLAANLLACGIACSPSGSGLSPLATAIDAYVRDWLLEHGDRQSISSATPMGVVNVVAGAATEPLATEWMASRLPVRVIADNAQSEQLAGVLHVSLDSARASTSERVVLVGKYQTPGSRCYTLDTRAVTLSGRGVTVTKVGFWYCTP